MPGLARARDQGMWRRGPIGRPAADSAGSDQATGPERLRSRGDHFARRVQDTLGCVDLAVADFERHHMLMAFSASTRLSNAVSTGSAREAKRAIYCLLRVSQRNAARVRSLLPQSRFRASATCSTTTGTFGPSIKCRAGRWPRFPRSQHSRMAVAQSGSGTSPPRSTRSAGTLGRQLLSISSTFARASPGSPSSGAKMDPVMSSRRQEHACTPPGCRRGRAPSHEWVKGVLAAIERAPQ
jgi:hypothetical protein